LSFGFLPFLSFLVFCPLVDFFPSSGEDSSEEWKRPGTMRPAEAGAAGAAGAAVDPLPKNQWAQWGTCL